jgi:hypothetical protein
MFYFALFLQFPVHFSSKQMKRMNNLQNLTFKYDFKKQSIWGSTGCMSNAW